MPRSRSLGLAACLLLAFFAARAEEPSSLQVTRDEQLLKNANLKSDGEALLTFFRRRTLAEGDRKKIQALIWQLGSQSYREREQAVAELIDRGPVVAEFLRTASKHQNLEIARRAEKCLTRIQEKDYSREIPAAAARLLSVRQPAGACETLLAFLPFADNDSVNEEVRFALAALAIKGGQADPVLAAALKDRSPFRRGIAAEALARANAKDHLPAIRKLLNDPEPGVRLQVAMALAFGRERQAVPVLIDLLPLLPLAQAWQAEDLLFRLAEGHKPPMASLGKDEAARKKCRDAWASWWKENQARVDLAKLRETPRLLGYTLLVLLDQGQVLEVASDKQPRWQIEGLLFPLDAQIIPGDRVLITEYQASRVTERDFKGNILWERRIVGPLVGQRLPNGNTFIATDTVMIEVDPKGKEVLAVTLPGERIMKAMKLPNGEIACLTSDSRVVRLDGTGKELSSFTVSLGTRLFGGRIHMLPNGHVLVPHNSENKVVEYGAAGKALWEVSVDQPVAATRLPNGNTLVTTMLHNVGAIELNRRGEIVWQYRASTRVTRALRR